MGRFSKDNIIEFKAFDRQDGLCALCGKELVRENYESGAKGAWAAHHINNDPEDNRLSKCACLCINKPDNCHLYAHHDDFTCNTVIPKSEYLYLNG